MAIITTTIGTNSRDYSTIALWEADLDNVGVYSASDDAVGECYNDSAFDELVTINGGGTVGLASRLLTVAAGERHDGTAGTGARIVRTSNGTPMDLTTVVSTVEWLEIDVQGFGNGNTNCVRLNATGCVARNLICHDIGSTFGVIDGILCFASDILNCFIYNIDRSAGGSAACHGIRRTGGVCVGHNISILNVTNDGAGISRGILTVNDMSNCIAMDTGGTTSGTIEDFSGGNQSFNLSSDTTATGTGSLVNKTSTDIFVSIAGGTEDLHLKSGADAIGAGTDLGTTPNGVEIDIDGSDRDALAVVWDIGAHQLLAPEVLRELLTRLSLTATPGKRYSFTPKDAALLLNLISIVYHHRNRI